jgi:hypothetical protein
MAATKHTIAIGMDYSPSSKAAVKWAADNLLKTGDRVVLIHVEQAPATRSSGRTPAHVSREKNIASSVMLCIPASA